MLEQIGRSKRVVATNFLKPPPPKLVKGQRHENLGSGSSSFLCATAGESERCLGKKSPIESGI